MGPARMCGLCFPPFSFDSSSVRTLPGLRSLRGLTTFVSALWHDTWGSATILGHSSHDSGCFSGAPLMSRSNEACWVGPHTTRCAACLAMTSKKTTRWRHVAFCGVPSRVNVPLSDPQQIDPGSVRAEVKYAIGKVIAAV